MNYYIHYNSTYIDDNSIRYYQVTKVSIETSENCFELSKTEFYDWVFNKTIPFNYHYINENSYTLQNSFKDTDSFRIYQSETERNNDLNRIIELNAIIQAKTDMNLDYTIEETERQTILNKY